VGLGGSGVPLCFVRKKVGGAETWGRLAQLGTGLPIRPGFGLGTPASRLRRNNLGQIIPKFPLLSVGAMGGRSLDRGLLGPSERGPTLRQAQTKKSVVRLWHLGRGRGRKCRNVLCGGIVSQKRWGCLTQHSDRPLSETTKPIGSMAAKFRFEARADLSAARLQRILI
jgi:hypothetical protein